MSLEDEIKKEEETLRKLEEEESGKNQEEKQDNDDDTSEDDGDDTDAEEEASKDDKPGEDSTDDDSDDGESDKDDEDDKSVKKDENPNDAAAKARIERRKRLKAEADAADLREQLAKRNEVEREPTAAEKTQVEPETADQRLDRIEAEREQERLHTQAAEELSEIENDFMRENPDYKDASTHMIKTMYQSVRQVYPNLSEKETVKFLQNKVLQIAGSAARRGQNPAEVLYQMAFDNYGYDPVKVATANTAATGLKKTGAADNLKKKAENRKRSANGLSGGGQSSGARVTIEEADKMSLADFGSMSEKEIDELIEQAAT